MKIAWICGKSQRIQYFYSNLFRPKKLFCASKMKEKHTNVHIQRKKKKSTAVIWTHNIQNIFGNLTLFVFILCTICNPIMVEMPNNLLPSGKCSCLSVFPAPFFLPLILCHFLIVENGFGCRAHRFGNFLSFRCLKMSTKKEKKRTPYTLTSYIHIETWKTWSHFSFTELPETLSPNMLMRKYKFQATVVSSFFSGSLLRAFFFSSSHCLNEKRKNEARNKVREVKLSSVHILFRSEKHTLGTNILLGFSQKIRLQSTHLLLPMVRIVEQRYKRCSKTFSSLSSNVNSRQFKHGQLLPVCV